MVVLQPHLELRLDGHWHIMNLYLHLFHLGRGVRGGGEGGGGGGRWLGQTPVTDDVHVHSKTM